MKIQKQREIVIEFERVQLIRKRAKTLMLNCRMCSHETDFIPLIEASKLFGTETGQLFQFIKANNCHFEINPDGEIYICLVSLLAQMKAKANVSRIKLIGGK